MHLSRWDIAVWISGDAEYLLLAAVLLIKKRCKAFPWFSLLLVTEILESIVLATVCAPRYHLRYFHAYWAGELLNAVLIAAVIFEVARSLARYVGINESVLLRDLRITASVVASLTSIAVLFGRLLPDLHCSLPNLALRIDTACCLMMFGLVGFVSLSIYLYGLRLQVHAAAIAYGLLIYCVGRMLIFATTLSSRDLALWKNLELWLKPVYLLTLLFWCSVFWFEEPKNKLSDGFGIILSKLNAIHSAGRPTQGAKSIRPSPRINR